MSKELVGYTNKLQLNPDGTITKFFVDDGTTSRPASLRLNTESQILKLLPNTPKLIEESPNSLIMSRIEGESNLDSMVSTMPEYLQNAVFEAVGKTLSYVHNEKRIPVTEEYIQNIIDDSILRVIKVRKTLEALDVKPSSLVDYFCRSVDRGEIKKHGLTITHGDYWLNNIIGQMRNSSFSVSGIVDWEMGGIATPYNDFANVQMSIFDYHPLSKESFWKGYGFKPNENTLKYFCLRQIIIWIGEDCNPDFNSDFYKPKIDFLRRVA